MGMAKRTRISQRMPQHIMLLKLALRITSSTVKSYQVDMFIAQRKTLVKPFLSPEALAGLLAVGVAEMPSCSGTITRPAESTAKNAASHAALPGPRSAMCRASSKPSSTAAAFLQSPYSSAPVTDGSFSSAQRKNALSGKHVAACSARQRRSGYFQKALVALTRSPIKTVGCYYSTGFVGNVNRHLHTEWKEARGKRVTVPAKRCIT